MNIVVRVRRILQGAWFGDARPWLCAWVAGVATWAGGGTMAWAQGYAPDEAAARMAVPPGLEVTLVASEPVIRQPVAIDFDDRGRLWVMQYLQYPNPAGLVRVAWDRFSRTTYDRVPEPPPRGPRGADRLTILEDKDGDGYLESGHDFLSGLNLASGFAFGQGGVFVLQVPYLLFYADRDNNDQPDGDPEVLLSGFGMEDAHSVANSLTWGPDGWLYGAQGSTVTANIRGVEFQQGVWRYHPRTRRFELFYEGGGNTWGVDFDAAGELLASTNFGPTVLLHGVQGGYYWKSFGKHGALHNDHAYGYFDHVPQANPQGGHVSNGGLVYRGVGLPSAFRERYVANNLLSHNVYWHELTRRGSTFNSRHGGTLLASNDTWFAPSDATCGPDGALYVADWHDQRTAHPDPDADWDRRNGRVFRIAATGRPWATVADLGQRSTADLVGLLEHEDAWYVGRARRVLAERRDSAGAELVRGRLVVRFGTVWQARDDVSPQSSREALWALYAMGGLDEAPADLLDALAHHGHCDVRRWMVRWAGDELSVAEPRANWNRVVWQPKDEPDVATRVQWAATARRMPAERAWPIVEQLGACDGDSDDPYLPLMLWWAVERHADELADKVLEFAADMSCWNRALWRDTILPRWVRRAVARHEQTGWGFPAALCAAAPNWDGQGPLIAAWEEQLRGVSCATTPVELQPLLRQVWSERSEDRVVQSWAARLGWTEARMALLAAASGETAVPRALRLSALATAAELRGALPIDHLLPALGRETDDELLTALVDAVAWSDEPRVLEALMATYDRATAAVRRSIRQVVFRRPAWAGLWIAQCDSGRFAPSDVGLDELRPLAAHGDAALQATLRRLWGTLQVATPEEKLAEVRRLNNDLRAAAGDARAGRALFGEHCASCHRLFDQGQPVGPDLTGANRHDRDYLLVSLVDPSATIRREYLNYSLVTHDGRIMSGLLVEEAAGAVTLLGGKAERTVVPRQDIETLEPALASLMPERLLEKLSPGQLRDLFSYLQATGPPTGGESSP